MLLDLAKEGGMTPEIVDQAGEVIDGGKEFTKEQIYALEQQEFQLIDNLLETKAYLTMLQEKNAKLNAKEETVQ